MRVSGWLSFTVWALVGVIYAFASLAMMSIGVFILIIAVLTTIAAARNLNVWPSILGLAASPAAMLAWIGLRTWSLSPCGPNERPGATFSASASDLLEPGTFVQTAQMAECTSVDAQLLVGMAFALLVAALIAYVVTSRSIHMGHASSI
jgi:hypothetical protein